MRRFSLRAQVLMGMIILLVISVGGIGFLNYTLAMQTLRKSLERQVDAIVDLTHNLLEHEVSALVSSSLKGITLGASQTVTSVLAQVKQKRLSDNEARRLLRRGLLSLPIGKTGYMAILDGEGRVVLHPKLPMGTNLSSFAFIQEAMEKKTGIVFYTWQNPGEKSPRDKVLYVSYLPDRDWYLFATTYVDEFADMVDVSTLQEAFQDIANLKSLSVFLIDTRGKVLSHPTLSAGESILPLLGENAESALNTIVTTGSGFVRYTRGNARGTSSVVAYFKKLSYFPWIIVAEMPEDFLVSQTSQLRLVNMTVLLLATVLMVLISYWISRNLRTSLQSIQQKLQNISSGTEKADLSRRIEIHLHNEIGELATLMNRFLDRINQDLLSVRETSQLLKLSTARSHEVMENTIKKSLESIKNKIIQIDYSTENATSGIEELTANLEEMSRSIQSIMTNMERQASAVEESASSIEEMVRNIENITATTVKSQTISTDLNNVAQEGGKAVKQAIASIKEVSEYSQQIMKMLQIISNIAKQTNLLAMNAAIEAAHAGEAGKGFAIVAEEIRRLSEDTNKNAKEITEVINVILDRIASSVKLSEQAGIGLDMIMAYSQQNVQIANQISLAMSEQNHGAKEILDSTHEMVKITEEVKLAITEQNAATYDFSDAVRGLRDVSIENKSLIQEHLKDLNELLTGLETIEQILNQVVSQSASLESLLGSFILRENRAEAPSRVLEN